MAESYGVTTTETFTPDSLLASLRAPRTIDIVIKSGEGVLQRGTVMSLDTVSGKYIQFDGTKDKAGVLGENADATSADVKSYLMFDLDVNLTGVFGLTTMVIGFDQASEINFK